MKPSDLPKGTLIAYHRDKQGLRGVVIAIDDDVLGWSLCHKNDKFSKEEGLKRAYKRARLAFRLKNEFNVRVIQRFYSRVPQTLKTVFAQQKARSNKYFKPEHPGVQFLTDQQKCSNHSMLLLINKIFKAMKGYYIGINVNPDSEKVVFTSANKAEKNTTISSINCKAKSRDDLMIFLMAQFEEKLKKIL